MPTTKLARTALSAILRHLGAADDAGKPFVAPATVFVSHAWRYRAVDVFDAMEAFAAQQAVVAPGVDVYFWFDLFVNDQHEAVSLPQLWWKEAFLDGARSSGFRRASASPVAITQLSHRDHTATTPPSHRPRTALTSRPRAPRASSRSATRASCSRRGTTRSSRARGASGRSSRRCGWTRA